MTFPMVRQVPVLRRAQCQRQSGRFAKGPFVVPVNLGVGEALQHGFVSVSVHGHAAVDEGDCDSKVPFRPRQSARYPFASDQWNLAYLGEFPIPAGGRSWPRTVMDYATRGERRRLKNA